MYSKERERIASSEVETILLGDTSRYKNILLTQKNFLQDEYPDPVLQSAFEGLDSRIISIAPMVLFDCMLSDLSIESREDLLAGIGLMMYSISTHDDVVDEKPNDRLVIAGLTYAGDIATLEGVKKLMVAGCDNVTSIIIDYLNLTNYTQTKIVKKLWEQPSNEEVYLEAINTTRYWAEIGLQAAITYAGRPDLHDFVDQFSIYYGKTCQIFDDIREIKDDLENGYWSLPISLAHENNWDLSTTDGLNMAIRRSHEIAKEYIKQAQEICGTEFPNLRQLVDKIAAGSTITY